MLLFFCYLVIFAFGALAEAGVDLVVNCLDRFEVSKGRVFDYKDAAHCTASLTTIATLLVFCISMQLNNLLAPFVFFCGEMGMMAYILRDGGKATTPE